MGLRKGYICAKDWRRVFLRRKRKPDNPFNKGRLEFLLRDLCYNGYFYSREWVRCDETGKGNYLWRRDKGKLKELQISSLWQGKRVTEISMEFAHFLTGKKAYLHIQWEAYDYKRGGRVTLRRKSRNVLEDDGRLITKDTPPYFEQILWSCEAFPKEDVLQEICDLTPGREKKDSLQDLLIKNHYIQLRAGECISKTDDETKIYWAGEFLLKDAQPQEAKYLYIVQVQTKVEQSHGSAMKRVLSYMDIHSWYMMRTRKPIEKFCLDNGVTIALA